MNKKIKSNKLYVKSIKKAKGILLGGKSVDQIMKDVRREERSFDRS